LLPTVEAMAKAGKWTWIDGGKAMTSTTHIANLVHAIELALTKGEGGEAYFILDDCDVSMHEIISGMAASKGLQLPDKSIPSWLADTLGGASEGIWRLFGLKSEPPLTRHAAMVMSRNCTLKGDKARAGLGYAPVISRAEGLARL
jgi:nucleoside-diphosphate-sugar epimerase